MKKLLSTLLFTGILISTLTAQVVVTAQGLTFTPADITINVGETVQWDNTGGTHNINGSQATFPNNPEDFFSGSPAQAPWNYSHTFNIAGNYDYQCDLHVGSGMVGTVTVIQPEMYPPYSIAEVTNVNSDGVADSLDVTCELTGIVYGVNLRQGGLEYTIIDKVNADDGIHLYNFSGDLGVSLLEGDEVVVRGIIDQFNGLTEISPDTIWVVSSGNTLHDPAVVTTLSEDTESKLIKLENMSFVDISQWMTGSSYGFNVDITNGIDTFVMRIDESVDLNNMPAPTFTTFSVTGLGGQFDPSSPYLDDYQLLPRYMEDIEDVLSFVDPEIGNSVEFFPNPVTNVLNIKSDINIDVIQISNVLGQRVMNIIKPENSEELNVSNLSPGIYVITFVSNDRIWSAEFVKQ